MKLLLENWRQFINEEVINSREDLISLLRDDPNQQKSLDMRKGEGRKSFGGVYKPGIVVDFDYGEFPDLINPVDDMGWDFIIADKSNVDDDNLLPVGHISYIEDETLDETKKKDPPLNKPTRNTGSGKKYKVFVRNPKTGKIKKITYGDAKGGLKGGWNSAEARKSFAARHKCEEKKDRTKAGYWACRAHKDFGPGIGRFW